jgi:hypothetical protein
MTGKENQNYTPLSIDQPTLYRIRVHGELEERWSGRMGGMQIHWQTQRDGSIMTILKGQLLDQAALFGVLMLLYNLRLPLISVEALKAAREDEHSLMDVRVEHKSDRLEFTVTGLQQALPTPEPIETVLNSCELAGVYRVLVDFRGLTGGDTDDPETGYARGVGQVYEKYLAAGGSPVKFAVVGKEKMIQAWKQSEELAREYGLEVFVTSDYEEAIAWLKSDTKGQ